jgi:maltoporin
LNEWKIGSHVHNIFFVNEELHVVSSNTSSIIKESNEVVCDVKFNDLKIYPRGFAETSDHYYLGISLFTVRRDDRSLESSYILQYNKQWKLIDSMELKDTGVLNDMFLK